MTAPSHPPRFRYVESGTLLSPGPIGRFVRLGLAAGCVYVVFELLVGGSRLITSGSVLTSAWWFVIALGLYVFPDVLNIGFGSSWNRGRVIGVLLLLAGLSAGIGQVFYGNFLDVPLSAFVYLWLFYTFGHLGLAFLLAVVLGTPGCEMRSIPQLWGKITGKEQKEHYCPGMLSPLDRWEASLGGSGGTK